MGLVQISERKAYKILKWAMVVIGGLLFAGGGVFMLTSLGAGASNISPQKIHFTAPGLLAHENEGYYSMDVFKKHTYVMVNTSPWGSSRKVTFEIQQGAESLSITPSIWPGETAVITLIGDENTPYQFGRPAVILVKSGQEQEFLHVNIMLPPDQVSFKFQLTNERTGQLLNELSAGSYFADVYHDYPISIETKSRFVFSSTLNVFSGLIEGTQFKASPQGLDYGIRLFGVTEDDIPPSGLSVGSSFTNIYIPVELLLQIIQSKESKTFSFMISAEYLGAHVNFFELKIVP